MRRKGEYSRALCDAYGGRLPEHKVSDHIGHCYSPCPFSTQSSDSRTRSMLRDLILELSGGIVDLTDVTWGPGSVYVIDDVDAALIAYLGYAREDHTTETGNRYPAYTGSDYLKRTTFSGTVFMATQARGNIWGFECAFNDCPYLKNEGKRYFYA